MIIIATTPTITHKEASGNFSAVASLGEAVKQSSADQRTVHALTSRIMSGVYLKLDGFIVITKKESDNYNELSFYIRLYKYKMYIRCWADPCLT